MSLPTPATRTDDIPADPVQPVQEEQPAQLVAQVPSTSQASSSNNDNFDPQSYRADELIAQLLDAGFDANTATLALRRTGYKGADEAIAWICDRSNPSDLEDESSDEDEEEEVAAALDGTTAPEDMAAIMALLKDQRSHKMIFVANMSLKMGVGKLAAQVGHATLAVYKQAMSNNVSCAGIESWTRRGQVKIVVRGESTEQLMDLFKDAKDKGLVAYLVQDAGYTQIPAGSRTVLGIFGERDVVDSVTGQLRLL